MIKVNTIIKVFRGKQAEEIFNLYLYFNVLTSRINRQVFVKHLESKNMF